MGEGIAKARSVRTNPVGVEGWVLRGTAWEKPPFRTRKGFERHISQNSGKGVGTGHATVRNIFWRGESLPEGRGGTYPWAWGGG